MQQMSDHDREVMARPEHRAAEVESGKFVLLGQKVGSVDPLVAMWQRRSGFSGWRYAVDLEFYIVRRSGVPFAVDVDFHIGSTPDWQFRGRIPLAAFAVYYPYDSPAMAPP